VKREELKLKTGRPGGLPGCSLKMHGQRVTRAQVPWKRASERVIIPSLARRSPRTACNRRVELFGIAAQIGR